MKLMRNIILGLLALTLVSCGGGDNPVSGGSEHFLIKGKIVDGQGKTLYLERFVDNVPVRFDSTLIDASGDFELYTEQLPLDFYMLSLAPDDACILILDTQDTEVYVNADAGKLIKSYAVNGSKNTQLLVDFYRTSDEFDVNVAAYKIEYQAVNGSGDTARIMEVQERVIKSQNDYYEYLVNFVKTSPESPACLSALQKLSLQNDLELYKMVAAGLNNSMPNSPYTQALAQQVTAYEQQAVALKQQEEQAAAMANVLKPGTQAPEINLNTPTGEPLPLSSLRGEVVLIDFWASWCKPCRAENPNVVRMYNKYKKSGFDIYSVSLDKNKGAWENAIQADGMTWNHVSDLAFWNSAAAKTYGVNSIPFTVLIDKDGKVIDTKLRGPALEEKLEEIFGF
jgi:thiol-disulfide isomerase/thioredoxin